MQSVMFVNVSLVVVLLSLLSLTVEGLPQSQGRPRTVNGVEVFKAEVRQPNCLS